MMQKRQKQPKTSKKISLHFNLDERQKNILSCIVGLAFLFLAVFILVSTFSYMFSWKADQSMLNEPLSRSLEMDARNMGGAVGNKLGYCLVSRWFGLSAFVLVYLFGYLGLRVWRMNEGKSVLKVVVMSLSATFILSWIFSLVSLTFNISDVYGGGLGGECGSQIVTWSSNLMGALATLLILVMFAFIWLFFASDRFLNWFNDLMSRKHVRKSHDEEDGESVSRKGGFRWGEAKEAENVPVEENVTPAAEETPQEEAAVRTPEASVPVQEMKTAPAAVPEPLHETVALQAGAVPVATPSLNDGLEIEVGKELSTEGKDLPHINVRDELSDYRFPGLDLLKDYESSRSLVSQEELRKNNMKIRATLKNYNIEVENVKAIVGPTVTLYKVYPAPGVRIATIINLQDDIAMSLNANGVRICKLSDSVGIEVANEVSSIVPMKAMLNDKAFRESDAELPVAIGYGILNQEVKVFDLAELPHILVAGATKQGKSVGLNVIISSLLYAKHPSELKFVFIDPKKVEFTNYARLLHHFLAVLPTASGEEDEIRNAIAKEPKPADQILKSLCIEMDARYDLLSKAAVNNVKSYNEKYKSRRLLPTEGHKYLPYIVAVVDEYADLTISDGSGGESKQIARSINSSIIRLAQKGRAAGIHVIIATQRPSVDIITGAIKGNFTARIAFRVLSSVDSKTILDSTGAEKLIGRGDMIYFDGGDRQRIQCAYISLEEIEKVTRFIADQQGYKKSYNTPYYLPAPEDNVSEDGVSMIDMKNLDERFEEAARLVVTSQKGSTSDLQRRLGMGYAKAGRVMDQLEAAGIVGPQEGSKPRQVLVSDLNELEPILQAYMNQ